MNQNSYKDLKQPLLYEEEVENEDLEESKKSQEETRNKIIKEIASLQDSPFKREKRQNITIWSTTKEVNEDHIKFIGQIYQKNNFPLEIVTGTHGDEKTGMIACNLAPHLKEVKFLEQDKRNNASPLITIQDVSASSDVKFSDDRDYILSWCFSEQYRQRYLTQQDNTVTYRNSLTTQRVKIDSTDSETIPQKFEKNIQIYEQLDTRPQSEQTKEQLEKNIDIKYSKQNDIKIDRRIRDLIKELKYSRIAKVYLEQIKIDENSHKCYLYMGEIAYQVKKYFTAIKYFTKALINTPKDQQYLSEKIQNSITMCQAYRLQKILCITIVAVILIASGIITLIYINYQDEKKIQIGEDLVEDAREQSKQGHYATALKFLEEALQINPKSIEALTLKGEQEYILKEYDLSIDTFESVLSFNPNSYLAFYNLGKIYEKRKKFEQAKIYYEKAIKSNSTFVGAQIKLGDYYNNTEKNYVKALKIYEKAIEINSKSQTLYFNKGLTEIFGCNSYKEGIKSLTKAIKLDLKYSNAYFYRGYTYQQINKIDRAKKDFHKVIDLNRDNYEAYFGLGKCYFNGEKYNEARIYFEKVLGLKSDFTKAKYLIGQCYLKQNDYEQAKIKFTDCISANKSDYEAYLGLGETYFNLNKPKDAEQSYEKAISLNPNNIDAYILQGDFYYNLALKFEYEYYQDQKIEFIKKIDSSISSYNEALKLNKDYTLSDELHYKLGLDFITRNDTTTGLKTLKMIHDQEQTKVVILKMKTYNNILFYNKSIIIFEKAQKANCTNSEIYALAALAESRQNNTEKANEYINKSLSLNKKQAKAYFIRGIFHQELQQDDLALQDYYNAVKYDMNIGFEMCVPVNNKGRFCGQQYANQNLVIQAYLNRGDYLAGIEDPEAEQYYISATQMNEELPDSFAKLSDYYGTVGNKFLQDEQMKRADILRQQNESED